MSRLHEDAALPRGLLAAFTALVVLPAAMLAVLGLRLLEQDRAIEERRRHELAESALDRAVAPLQKQLAQTLQLGADSRVLFVPDPPALPEPPASVFADADQLEFQSAKSGDALAENQRLLSSSDPAIRAGALLRTARIQRKRGDLGAAIAAWGRLAAIDDISIAGEPAGLMARRATCRALKDADRRADLAREAQRLLDDLHRGRWAISKETFLIASDQAQEWLGRSAPPPTSELARAEALAALWPRRNAVEGALCLDSFTLIWNRGGRVITTAPVTPPAGVVLSCQPPAQGTITRPPSATSLPWHLSAAIDPQPLPEFAARRTALLAALFVLLILISAAAYFAWRSVMREFGAARLQSDFVAAVSHEFRTPLTSLQQFNEMLSEDPHLPASTRLHYYQAQARATNRLRRLVETLLDFGRMEAGRRPYRLQPLDAAPLIKALAAEFANEPAARGFEIDCQVAPRPLEVKADPDALWRALWNLLDNAVKYSGSSRRIEIGAETSNGRIEIRVSDHGLGIPVNEQPRLFEKFVRGESIRESGIPGTGIGLAMVRHIAEAHGGGIRVTSAEGAGSTFTLFLPEEVQHA